MWDVRDHRRLLLAAPAMKKFQSRKELPAAYG